MSSSRGWTAGQDSLIEGRAKRGLRLPSIPGDSTHEVQVRADTLLLSWRERTEIMTDFRRNVSATATAEAFGVDVLIVEEVRRMASVPPRTVQALQATTPSTSRSPKADDSAQMPPALSPTLGGGKLYDLDGCVDGSCSGRA